MSITKHHFITNLLIYQASWLACVLGAGYGMPWFGVIIVAGALGYHLSLATKPTVELTLICCVMVVGGLWDSFLVTMDWLKYDNGMLINGVAPYWIIALWIAFATTLNISLAWFKQHLWLASLFGTIGGPLAYLGGEKLGAVQFSDPIVVLSALAVGWTIIMPLMMLLSRSLNGFEANESNTLTTTPSIQPSTPHSSKVR
jgi:Protein of unknown function (DUF2878)